MQVLSVVTTILLAVAAAALIVLIRTLNRMVNRIEDSLARTQGDVTTTLRRAQAAFERMERLAQSSDEVLREDVSPTLEVARSTMIQIEAASRSMTETVDGVQRVVRGLVAVSGPGALAMVTQRLLRKGNKLGLLAFGVGAGLRAFFSDGSRRNR